MLRGSSYTDGGSCRWFEGRARHESGGGAGRRMRCRKGVKACVILERGAMFEFPDDGRNRYFDALDGLPPTVILCKICPRKAVIRVPRFFFLLFLSGSIPTLSSLRGAAGIPGLKRFRHFCSWLYLRSIFIEIVSARSHVTRLLVKLQSVQHTVCSILGRALEGQYSDMQQVVSRGEQPYCIWTARNLGHMLINTNWLESSVVRLTGRGLTLAAWPGCVVWLPHFDSQVGICKTHITWMAAASDMMVHSVL